MTTNAFGGGWTREKLGVLKEYLHFYAAALSKQRFRLVYIDAFAGTGRCRIRERGSDVVIDGSAKIALDRAGFDEYRFIEKKPRHQVELRELLASHPHGGRAKVAHGSAVVNLPVILREYDWKKTRGVLFLDPFGLQCTYEMLRQIAATGALDVFFLVSLSGLYRQAAINVDAISDDKAAALTAFLGTDEWREMYEEQPQQLLWGAPPVVRERGWEQILAVATKQLRAIFPYVGKPSLLGKANGAPLFALYFAVSNRSGPAIGLARRVSDDILSKLPS